MGMGVDELVTSIDAIITDRRQSGAWDKRRVNQLTDWFNDAVSNSIRKQIKQNESLSLLKENLKIEVATGKVHPFSAAQTFVSRLFQKGEN